jgi:protein-disulfide isomerase
MGRVALLAVLSTATTAPVARATPVPTAASSVVSASRASEAPTRGPANALVTVELFCNFAHVQCPTIERRLRELADHHPGELRVVYRQVVLPFKDSVALAEAALEAHAQGRFDAFADLASGSPTPVRGRDLDGLAARAGLEVDALHAALADHRHAAALERDGLRRERLSAGNLALLWNGESLPVDTSSVAFERDFAHAAERARALLDQGVAPARVFPLLDAAAAHARARAAAATLDARGPRVRVSEGGAPARGPADAAVTILVWSDFECPFCRRQADLLSRLRAVYPDDVRVVWRHLPEAYRPTARTAAELAACAGLQGRFWELYDAFFAPGRLFASDLEKLAEKIGLDRARLAADRASGRCAARVDTDAADARAAGVDAAPTLFVNGLRLTGAQGLGSLRQVVDAELAPGLLENLAGRP